MRHFPDRFTVEYLTCLLEQLQLDHLIKTADYEPFDDEMKRKSKKCIMINFCGLAASTLLGNEIGNGHREKGTAELREKIRKAFYLLFEKTTLKQFNELNIYLRIRFCFSYLYTDFPACLIKAEDPENWKYTGEGLKYEFHYTDPITETQLKASRLFMSQQASLEKIFAIINENPLLIKRDGMKEKHFVQVRFAVIPSPICLLVINNVICCDSYVYSKFPKELEGLSLHYPISVVEKENDPLQFQNLRNHFNYIWRHDLTLFCGDATEFTEKRIEGLKVLRSPNKITWGDKETRIRKSKLRNLGVFVKIDDKQVARWRKKLTQKLKLSTSKVICEDTSQASGTRIFLKRLGTVYTWIITIAILGLISGLVTLFVSRPTFDRILEWLTEHSLFSILLAGISGISFLAERINSALKSYSEK